MHAQSRARVELLARSTAFFVGWCACAPLWHCASAPPARGACAPRWADGHRTGLAVVSLGTHPCFLLLLCYPPTALTPPFWPVACASALMTTLHRYVRKSGAQPTTSGIDNEVRCPCAFWVAGVHAPPWYALYARWKATGTMARVFCWCIPGCCVA